MEGGGNTNDVVLQISDTGETHVANKENSSESFSNLEVTALEQNLGYIVQATTITSSTSPNIATSTPAPNKPPETPSQSLTQRKSVVKDAKAVQEKKQSVNSPTNKINTISAPGNNLKSALEETDEDEQEDEDEDIMGKIKVFFVMIEFIAFGSIMGLLIASLTTNKLKNYFIWDLELWKWCVLVMVIFSGRLVSQWLITASVLLIEKNCLLKHMVLYFVFGLRTSVSIFIWFAMVLLAWLFLFDNRVKWSKETSKILYYITRALVSSLLGATLWLVKTFSIKLLATSFQTKRFFKRIQDSVFHQYVLQALSTRKPGEQFGIVSTTMQFIVKITKGEIIKQNEMVIDVEEVRKMKQGRISPRVLRRLTNFISSSKLSTISNELDELREMTSESEAKHAADHIFTNIVSGHECNEIGKEQLEPFFDKKQHVKQILKMFEGKATNGKINQSDFKKWVVNTYKERESLRRSLKDAKTAIEELNKLFTGIVIIFIVIVSLLLMGFLTSKVLLIITSQLLLVAFMFGNTAKTIFEAIIFVFIMHPFDVGDRCVIDGIQMVVEEMNILTTIFLRYDKEKIFYPNSVLATKPISNFYRSPPEMGDGVEFAIDVSTPIRTIEDLKSSIKDYLKSKPEHWSPDHSVVVKEIEDLNKMTMALYVSHTMNFQDYGEKSKRRSDLLLALKKIFEKLGIQYHLLPQQVHLSGFGSVVSVLSPSAR